MEIKLIAENEQYIEPQDVVSRLAQSMPKVMIDWVRGNELVEEKRRELVTANAPQVILASHQSLLNRTACVQIWFPQFPDTFVHLIVQPYSAIVLRSSDPTNDEIITYSSAKIAHALGYKLANQL